MPSSAWLKLRTENEGGDTVAKLKAARDLSGPFESQIANTIYLARDFFVTT
jgi:hypothetical protein